MRERIILLAIIQGAFVGITAYYALTSPPSGASGWWQVAIAIFGLPILLYQLYEILKALRQEPELDIGLATVKDLPTSEIREKKAISTSVEVSYGYAHFYLVIKNLGITTAKYMKIHFEYKSFEPSEHQIDSSVETLVSAPPELRRPLLKVDEFSKDKQQFVQENNVECTFNGGTDGVIYPKDTGIFGFRMSTSTISRIKREHADPIKMPEYPALGECIFDCTVWAEGLNKPIKKRLILKITDNK